MIVQRYYERFKKMSSDGGRPVMPEGYSAELDMTPIRLLIKKRLEEDTKNAHRAER